jgi:hypothetical protein
VTSAREPILRYAILPSGKATVTCACGWEDPLGPVAPSPFDPLEALVAARAEHPRCEIRDTPVLAEEES